MRFKVPYGKKNIEFSLDERQVIDVVAARPIPCAGIKVLFDRSLDDIDAKSRLNKLLAKKGKILVVVPDATRAGHLKELLPVLFTKINRRPDMIDIIVATGLHMPLDTMQLEDLLGKNICRRHNVYCHNQSAFGLASMGVTKKGVPIILNKMLLNYDIVISVGVIEPHLYAGYSGGFKTAAIGLAGEETIDMTHGIRFLDDPMTKLGLVTDNPFQETLREICDRVRLLFSVNVVNDQCARPAKIFSGSTARVFRKGVSFAKKLFEVEVKKSADIVICGIGCPKDVNLYQASRAVNYILNVDMPILKKGGFLIIVAELRDGIGDGLTESRFYKSLKGMNSAEDFVNRTRRTGCLAGTHRAYMVARAMRDYNILFVTLGNKDFMNGLPFPCFNNIESAVKYAGGSKEKKSMFYIVPHALSTIARRRLYMA